MGNVFDVRARSSKEREWDLREAIVQPIDRLRRIVVCWVDYDMITGFFDLQVPVYIEILYSSAWAFPWQR